jgi:hypothetical protein
VIERLDLGKGLRMVGVIFPSPEHGKASSFQNVVFYSYLEFLMMDKVQETGDSESVVMFKF